MMYRALYCVNMCVCAPVCVCVYPNGTANVDLMIIQGEYNRGTTFSFYMTPVCKVWTRCKNIVSILESEEALNFKAENKIYELLC